MRGRKPKPTALKVVQGNPGRRPLNKLEPKPEPGIPVCPSWLSSKGKFAWKEISTLLGDMRVLTKADRKALELLCDAYSEYRDARAVIQKDGATYEAITEAGSIIVRSRPEVAISSDAWRRVKTMLSEFGLTPSSRSRIQVPDKKKSSVWDEMNG
jgi:P27 family predicted phage terminase small subunit